MFNIVDPRIGTHHLDHRNLEIPVPRNKMTPDTRASLDFGRSGIKKMSKRNITVRATVLCSYVFAI